MATAVEVIVVEEGGSQAVVAMVEVILVGVAMVEAVAVAVAPAVAEQVAAAPVEAAEVVPKAQAGRLAAVAVPRLG